MKMPAILPSTRLAIQVGASALVALAFVDEVDLERPYWVVLTAVIVMVGSFGETLARSIDRTVGTLLGLLAGFAIYWAATSLSIPGIVLLAVSAPCVIFFKFASYRLFVVAITVLLVFLFRLGGGDDALLIARLVDTAIGAAIATVVSLAVLRIPTLKPVTTTIDAYVEALKAMVHDSLGAVVAGEWSEAIDSRANALRDSETGLERLIDALKMESALLGGGGRVARGALSLLPIVRWHVDTMIQAAEPAALCGLGPEIAEELKSIDARIAANLELLRQALETGVQQPVPRLDDYAERIETTLAPKLAEGAGTRRDVMTVLNVILALRRLNRGIRHAMEMT
jgi:Fusaric acid resistance protein-like